MATQKIRKPLIRYAGSAAETSIGSKPIGSELNYRVYSRIRSCQAWSVRHWMPPDSHTA